MWWVILAPDGLYLWSRVGAVHSAEGIAVGLCWGVRLSGRLCDGRTGILQFDESDSSRNQREKETHK